MKGALVMAKKELTTRRKRFCDEYILSLNATQAAKAAGYSEKTAYSQGQRLLKKVEIIEYITKIMTEKKNELIADQDEILRYLTAVMRKKCTSSVLARDEVGADRVIEKRPDEKEATKAAELLGKRYGLWIEKLENNIDMDLKITIDYGADDK